MATVNTGNQQQLLGLRCLDDASASGPMVCYLAWDTMGFDYLTSLVASVYQTMESLWQDDGFLNAGGSLTGVSSTNINVAIVVSNGQQMP